MGGKGSDLYIYFKTLIVRGFMEIRKHIDTFITMISIMLEDSDLPCFAKFDFKVFTERFKIYITDKEVFLILHT